MTDTITTWAYPRAALAGNPSDGFFGRTIAFTFSNFCAQATLSSADNISIGLSGGMSIEDNSIDVFRRRIITSGYHPELALAQATVKTFFDYCDTRNPGAATDGFRLTVQSDIPYQVGIAGSSAIIVALLRALMQHTGVTIEKPQQANLALQVETEELGVPGGLQDRVAQVYQGLVYMDFDKALIDRRGFGHYELLDAHRLPPLYIAYRQSIAEGSEVFHSDIRQRFAQGDPSVLAAIKKWKELTDDARIAIEQGDFKSLHQHINTNFDYRARMYSISQGNLEMIRIARQCGASAKFTGSGGAAVGSYRDQAMYQQLQRRFAEHDICIFQPDMVPPHEHH